MTPEQERLDQLGARRWDGSVTESQELLSVVRDQAEQITALRAEIAATNVHGKFSGAEWLLGFDAITDRRAALAAGGAPTEPATCIHGKTHEHELPTIGNKPARIRCLGPVPQGGTE